ncbi:meiotic nuclear division protein 1 homolog [Pollicipes pollicipes]|uniref:meiotic nuclear division protein 1 homolog n=1 Tax=Pollicipes pollicipes TaxID=41117 RepID=UPI00188505DB|nr:meiotic nuclear division protein 1 homolog [Pollicipes pollicipes]XP_037081428.1 meiotic nuclear division protein 1 homolog [Pollicipes pollicipes]XP_037090252.1 meiotic nuclear division protein 1 homolog [Pollicipes pollicipes]XP_037090253.1 meiotic nuclear division protein 1 homolog [Pollicipes pollicipes]XP_037090254.1 meiotic nuclear division protein 1 homolog [Pollicipes pollicipes]XP_037090255.1 meiotic nuclear division protein 1 homolog [Pollicipes pollicipes]XP_037090256.1 meiotic 
MSKRKGVSAEEKRTRMLDLLYEKQDFFQLKELERLGPKEKGVVSQSVKEVIQGLVDDGLVDTDKIGTSVYFWAFPSKGAGVRQHKLAGLEEQLAQLRQKRHTVEAQLAEAAVGREEDDERGQLLKDLAGRRQERARLDAEIAKYKDCDPEALEAMRQQSRIAIEAANRWTDNIFNIKSWCKRKFSMEEATIDKQFGIPDSFDYLE